jgi:hypothetical protein
MMIDHGHFIERCRDCKVVLRQCRCPGPKVEKVGLCIPCSELEAKQLGQKLMRGSEAHLSNVAGGPLRFSTAIRRLRNAGEPDMNEAADKIEEMKKKVGSHCVHHGPLEDPILVQAGVGTVAFGCPWCSGDTILKAWEDEGRWTEEQILCSKVAPG